MGKTAVETAQTTRDAGQDDPTTDHIPPANSDPPADSEGRDDFTPRLRILNRQSWRGSFRLEEVFWSILEEAAAADGRRLNEYVYDLLAGTPECANKSSLLRAHAARWQRERARAARELPPGVANAVAACPVPCFVMGRDRRIRLFNRGFLDFLRGPGAAAAALAGPAPRMKFQMPLAEIVGALRKGRGKAVDCGLRAVVGRRVAEGRARICLIGDHEGDWRIMVFVLG